jgi:hypothetical protein
MANISIFLLPIEYINSNEFLFEKEIFYLSSYQGISTELKFKPVENTNVGNVING